MKFPAVFIKTFNFFHPYLKVLMVLFLVAALSLFLFHSRNLRVVSWQEGEVYTDSQSGYRVKLPDGWKSCFAPELLPTVVFHFGDCEKNFDKSFLITPLEDPDKMQSLRSFVEGTEIQYRDAKKPFIRVYYEFSESEESKISSTPATIKVIRKSVFEGQKIDPEYETLIYLRLGNGKILVIHSKDAISRNLIQSTDLDQIAGRIERIE